VAVAGCAGFALQGFELIPRLDVFLVEGFTESFAFFILSPNPDLISIANEKILFFYEFPELVELRRRILNQLCVEFPQ